MDAGKRVVANLADDYYNRVFQQHVLSWELEARTETSVQIEKLFTEEVKQ